MTKLHLKQNQLLDNSEKSLFNVFSPFKPNYNSELSFLEKLKILRFNDSSKVLQERLFKIEEKLGEKEAINYLNGYLEYHDITIEDIINKTNNN